MQWVALIGVLASVVINRPVWAQLPVIDVITNANTSVTAIQTTISAVEAVLHTAHWIIEQTPFDEAVQMGDLAEDMAEIEALVSEAQALGYELSSLSAQMQALFGLEGAPATTAELSMRLVEIRGHIYRVRSYAVRSQTLLQSAIRTVARIVRLYDRLMAILGNLSGQQQLSEHLTQLVTLQTQQNVAGMASQLAENMDRLQEPLILESLDRINEATMATHPR